MKENREKLKTRGRVWFLIPQFIQYNFCNLCQFEEWGKMKAEVVCSKVKTGQGRKEEVLPIQSSGEGGAIKESCPEEMTFLWDLES